MYSGTISGKKLIASIGGSFLAGNFSWTFRDAGDELDATTGADRGFGDTDVGVVQGEGTLNVFIEIASGISTLLVAGAQLTSVALFYDIDDATPAVECPIIKVLEVERRGEVKGRFEATIRFKTRGEYSVYK